MLRNEIVEPGAGQRDMVKGGLALGERRNELVDIGLGQMHYRMAIGVEPNAGRAKRRAVDPA
jgi:hypothetical protein